MPDLFPLAINGNPRKVKWVMVVNLNPGGIAGGSGGQYFVGRRPVPRPPSARLRDRRGCWRDEPTGYRGPRANGSVPANRGDHGCAELVHASTSGGPTTRRPTTPP